MHVSLVELTCEFQFLTIIQILRGRARATTVGVFDALHFLAERRHWRNTRHVVEPAVQEGVLRLPHGTALHTS